MVGQHYNCKTIFTFCESYPRAISFDIRRFFSSQVFPSLHLLLDIITCQMKTGSSFERSYSKLSRNHPNHNVVDSFFRQMS